MNARVWRLLRDYLGRTNGAWWLILAFVQVIQTATFAAASIHHAPLLATVLASFTYAFTSGQSRGALAILPVTPIEAALCRWWCSFGLPALVVMGCSGVAVMLSSSKGWPLPAEPQLEASAVAVVVVLGWLSNIEARVRLAPLWGTIAVAGLVGIPVIALSRPLLLLLAAVGVSLGICSSTLTATRRQPTRKTLSGAPFAGWLRGWNVLFMEVGRLTALLCVTALAATAILHVAIAPRRFAGVHGAVLWLFVSAIAMASCLPMRRWVEAVRSLRILPLDSRWLASILYFTLMVPGVVTLLVVIGAQQLSPRLGLDIPWYVLIVFLLAPITLVRWQMPRATNPAIEHWIPAIQQAAWPIWAGSFCTLRGVPYMPSWFLPYLAIVAAFFIFAGYKALLAGIRSPARLESRPGMLPS